MPPFPRRALRVCGAVALALTASTASAAGTETETDGDADGAASADAARARCKASYEGAQVLVRAERYRAAKAQLLVCEESCPAPLVADCRAWSRDVETLTPTVVLAVRGLPGGAVSDVRVTEDGQALDAPFSGPLAVEPGAHVFVFERAGYATSAARVEIHAGERGRVVAVSLTPAATEEKPPLRRASPAASYVVGGFGIAALLAAGVLTIKGHLDRSSLRDTCAPTCDSAAVDAIRVEWWTAAGLAVGGAAALGAAVLLWPTSARQRAAALPVVSISPRAVAATWTMP